MMPEIIKQYNHFQNKYPSSIVLIRVGDFYEAFNNSASVLNSVCGIPITHRKDLDNIPMVGVPFHSVDIYLKKLTEAGHKVGLVEQLENPADGVVKRDLVRLTECKIVPVPESEV